MVIERSRDLDLSRFGRRPQACSDIHAIATEIATHDHNVGKVKPKRMSRAVAPGNGISRLHRRSQRVNGASEFGKHGVAGGVENSPLVAGDDISDHLHARGHACDGSLFVGLHGWGGIDEVSHHDRGQSSLHVAYSTTSIIANGYAIFAGGKH